MSYPDLVEENGRYFVTETQKSKAMVHEIDPEFLDTLWKQLDCHKCMTENVILDISDGEGDIPGEVIMPRLPVFIKRDLNKADYGKMDLHRSFALELSIRMNSLRPGQIVLDSRDDGGRGIALRTSPERTLEIVLCDGQTINVWDTDPGALEEGRLHHIVINVDGRLLDGGDYRQFGWGRFSPNLADVNGSGSLRIASELDGELESLRIYSCYLLTSEAVGNYRAACICY